MERYHFFASSCRQFGFNAKSLSELMKDESEADGALATVLKVLKRTHQMFFDPVSYIILKELCYNFSFLCYLSITYFRPLVPTCPQEM